MVVEKKVRSGLRNNQKTVKAIFISYFKYMKFGKQLNCALQVENSGHTQTIKRLIKRAFDLNTGRWTFLDEST
jgi:hypothetical protein